MLMCFFFLFFCVAVRKKRRLEDSKPSAEDLKFLESHTTFAPCRATGLRGFLNMGSTCFMSVILQSLIHNPLVRNFYLSDGHKQKECEQTNCMSCAMDEVFSEFFTSDKMDGYGPVNLLTTSWKCEQVKKILRSLLSLVGWESAERLQGFSVGIGTGGLPAAGCPRVPAVFVEPAAQYEQRHGPEIGGLLMHHPPFILWQAAE
jgi:hypothetical protein